MTTPQDVADHLRATGQSSSMTWSCVTPPVRRRTRLPRSLRPPHTPFVHDSARATPRHSERTAQPSQTTRAGSADSPVVGKKSAGSIPLQFARACHSGRRTMRGEELLNAGRLRRHQPLDVELVHRGARVGPGCAPRADPTPVYGRTPWIGCLSPAIEVQGSSLRLRGAGRSCTTTISRAPTAARRRRGRADGSHRGATNGGECGAVRTTSRA